jgi:multiple sugar transport system ATP-binding protein
MAEVVLDGVSKRYGKVLAVDRISFHCADGEFFAILGPSGCGKSSTMRMIAGLEEISEGTIMIGGRRVNDLGPADRDVAMAFENFGLYPHRSVFGNIAYPLRLRGRDDESIALAVVEIATILGIEGFLNQYPRELSVGATQRVSLARALVRQPAVFLMDEPFSHVDAELRGHMRSELKRLHTINGSTSIYVTHDQLEALTMADRIVVMDKGVVQQIGTPSEIYRYPSNRFVATFIGEPPMNTMPGRVVRTDTGAKLTVEGAAVMDLPEPLLGRLEARELDADGRIDVGIRPDDFVLATSEGPGLTATIRVREIIGTTSLLSIDTGEHRLRVRVDRDLAPSEGASVRLQARSDRVYLFDAKTGMAVWPAASTEAAGIPL